MVGKNNHRVRFEKSTNKFKRFTLKKLSVGVASVAIGAGFVIGSGEVAQAEEVSPEQALEKAPTASVEEALTSEPKQGQEATSTEISIEEPAQENTQAGEVSSESTTEENAAIEGNVAEPDQTREEFSSNESAKESVESNSDASNTGATLVNEAEQGATEEEISQADSDDQTSETSEPTSETTSESDDALESSADKTIADEGSKEVKTSQATSASQGEALVAEDDAVSLSVENLDSDSPASSDYTHLSQAEVDLFTSKGLTPEELEAINSGIANNLNNFTMEYTRDHFVNAMGQAMIQNKYNDENNIARSVSLYRLDTGQSNANVNDLVTGYDMSLSYEGAGSSQNEVWVTSVGRAVFRGSYR